MLIAIFALLINSKKSRPDNGRISVIGSSVFSLAANVFQINSANRVVNSITIIDLITSFAALIILLSFLISVRTLSFWEDEGYPTSKIFDQAMFATLFMYTVVFFCFIYQYTLWQLNFLCTLYALLTQNSKEPIFAIIVREITLLAVEEN